MVVEVIECRTGTSATGSRAGLGDITVGSAGIHPAIRVHPRSVTAEPRLAAEVHAGDELGIAACERADEDLGRRPPHWLVADPTVATTAAAFEDAAAAVAGRIARLVASLEGETS